MFIVTKYWKQPRWLSYGKKINKLWLHSYNGIILNNKKKWIDIHIKKKVCTILKKKIILTVAGGWSVEGEQENVQTN